MLNLDFDLPCINTPRRCSQGSPTYDWLSKTASQLLIQLTVRIWQLGSVHKIHIPIEATSPFNFNVPCRT